MSPAPRTSVSLLHEIRDPSNESAWSTFHEIYAPLIFSYARHHRLQAQDAADVTQDVLQQVVKSMASFEYDPQIGRFSGWLLTVTRNRVREFVRRLPEDRGAGRTTILHVLDNQVDDERDRERWLQTERLRLTQWAMEQVQGQFEVKTWKAFELTAVSGQAAQVVADQLDISIGAVYIARSRVTSRIRDTVSRVLDSGCDS